MAVIEAKEVFKSYGTTLALAGVSFQIQKGSLFALLGPNGAGKSTFLKGLLGLVHLDKGEILLHGKNAGDAKAREHVAYLPEKFSFYPYYTIEAVLSFFGRMYGTPTNEIKHKMENALKLLKISDLRKRKLSTLSKGQLQRLGIANLLMGDSDILLLDEPFSGLDPIGIKELKELLRELKNQGKTIFINSHILSEMEQLCDEMALINKGRVLAYGPLKEVIAGQSLEDFFYQKVQEQGGSVE